MIGVGNVPKKYCRGCKTTEVGSNGFCSVCMTSIYGYYYAETPNDMISQGSYKSPTIEKSADIVYGEIKPPMQYNARSPKHRESKRSNKINELQKPTKKSSWTKLKKNKKGKKQKLQNVADSKKKDVKEIGKKQIIEKDSKEVSQKVRRKAADKTQYFRFLQEYGSKTKAMQAFEEWKKNGRM